MDDVAAMVATPGAARAGLWFAAHEAHGALVAQWMRSAVDVVIAVGPFWTPEERAALLSGLTESPAVHAVVIDAPVSVTFQRATADPARGLSREEAFHTESHARFRALLPEIPADQTFDSGSRSADSIATAILDALGT